MDPLAQLNTALEGRYVVEREIGQGGMATVFLSEDVRHNRKVALKVLRPELAAVIGAERFLAEIKTTAKLQHPHILPLHDSGAANGTVFYVMPFVEGESLRDRLNHEKQLPIDEALRIAREVASALDYAHRHGVVHRDIKPENILLHDGQALVADFGIALAVSRSDGASRMTETGMSLGTPHYMAPEQAMGEREITPKADVYALGCVLYEMLTGDPPFTGSTAQAIVARTITEHPRSMVAQRHTIPPHVEAAVLTALEKLPADRFATASEFSAALDNPELTRSPVSAPGASRSQARTDWTSRLAVSASVVAALAIAGLGWMLTRPLAPGPVTRYQLSFPPAAAPLPNLGMAVSSDGSHLVYVGPGDSSGTQLWVKARDRDTPSPLPGTSNVSTFTVSPDGRSVAFVQQNLQLKTVALVSGAAMTVADGASPSHGVAWLDDGTIVYVAAGAHALKKVPAAGGVPVQIWQSDLAFAWYPAVLPGSRGLLFTRCSTPLCAAETDLWAIDLHSLATHRVETGVVRAQYVPTGHLLLVRRDGVMLAEPFSARALKPRGAPVPVLDSIAQGHDGIPMLAVSSEGTLFMRSGPSMAAAPSYELVWVDRAGREMPVDSSFTFRLTAQGSNAGWALSPEGDRLAIGLNTEAGDQVWVKQLPHGPAMRMTFDSVQNYRPRWMRDGKTVMYVSRRSLNGMLYKRAADGTGSDELVLKLPTPGVYEGAWSPDGTWLVFRAGGTMNQVGGRDILIVHPGIDSTPKPFIANAAFDESEIAISPDGKWIAYESNETGRAEVFIRPFPNADAGKWQVSSGGGRAPLWTRSGRELFFVNGSRDIAVVTVNQGASPGLSASKVLFHMRDEWYLGDQENYTPFDISPDGQRFIMARRVRSTVQRVGSLLVVENWFVELRRKLAKQ